MLYNSTLKRKDFYDTRHETQTERTNSSNQLTQQTFSKHSGHVLTWTARIYM